MKIIKPRLQEARHMKNRVVLIFHHIQCLYLMNSEVSWVLVFLGTQVQTQIILGPDYLSDYVSVSYEYGLYNLSLTVFFVKPM